uniref:HD domain-containing protein n=1 Tax=Panagrolaimus sp. PS1159 TaxID=55785 RepID=A0AC35F9R4_9BILA
MDSDVEEFILEDFEINCGVWYITLPKICRFIIDTPIFQRLRRIKQNGITELVYPDATHTRFTHSLGVASLAYEFMNGLHEKYSDCVTKKEILIVTIAALVHDLGHGPFSHLFEDVFDGKFCHEEISGKLFVKIVNDYANVRKGLSPLNDADFALIQQLIHPPTFENCTDSDWPLLVPREKAYLFAIVSNPLNGLDVDKMEYLIRDSSHCGVQSYFNKDTVKVLIKSAKICKHLNYDFSWIAFCYKHYKCVHKIFETRKDLYQIVYNHRYLLPASEMGYKKAIQLAAPYLMFKGKNGNMIPLNQCYKDMDAYIKLDDSLYSLIINSTLPEMEGAQKILEELEFRSSPKIIAKFDEIPPRKCAKVLKVNIEKLLKGQIYSSFNSKDIYVTTKSFNGGKGDSDPLQKVLFYTRPDETKICIFNGDSIQSKHCIFIFASASKNDAKKILEYLKKFSKENGIEEPKYMFKNE